MKKLVIKVVLISLVAIIAIASITYLMLSIFSPITLAKLYGNVGGYKIATGYAEKQYEKTGNIEDIVLAADYAYKTEDDETVIKCTELALNDSGYAEYRLENEDRVLILLSHYIKAKYAIAGGEIATEQAFKYLVGYKSNNVVETLIVAAYENGDMHTLAIVLTKLEAIDVTKLSSAEAAVLYNDLIIVKNILGINE